MDRHHNWSLVNDPTPVHMKKTGATCHYLDDFIWTEILCRLSSPKLAVRCKSVFKRWKSLISREYFITRFIEHHREKNNHSNADDQLFWFFATFQGQPDSFLPRRGYQIENSFNDLLVCSDFKTKALVFHIYNPFTKENIELPACRTYELSPYQVSNVGFVCEPFYTQRPGQLSLNPSYRYRVIHIVNSSVETYCSETRQWSVHTNLGNDYRCDSNVVAHNGKLWWYNLHGKVVVYDPFVTMDGKPCFYFHSLKITASPTTLLRFQLAVSQGSLLFMVIMGEVITKQCEVLIWKLKEKEGHDDHHAWLGFDRRIIVNDIISDTAPSFLHEGDPFDLMLCVHPSNQDVIFFFFDKYRDVIILSESESESESESLEVASYNLVAKEWQLVDEIQQFHPWHLSDQVFAVPATRQWWPTPVH